MFKKKKGNYRGTERTEPSIWGDAVPDIPVWGPGCDSSFFFFQAEDGIRCDLVTGVQTCALPISCDLRLEGQEEEKAVALPRYCTGDVAGKRRDGSTRSSKRGSLLGPAWRVRRARCGCRGFSQLVGRVDRLPPRRRGAHRRRIERCPRRARTRPWKEQ